jgi:hypothetical protein
MHPELARDLSRSASAISRLAWPALADGMGGGWFAAVEGAEASAVSYYLDTLGGVDGWQILDAVGVRAVACRAQFGTAHDTFAIRYARPTGAETEWSKRCRALDAQADGWLCPYWTIQAYITGDGSRLLAAAAIRTVDLYAFARANLGGRCFVKRPGLDAPADTTPIVVVPWAAVLAAGVPLVLAPSGYEPRAWPANQSTPIAAGA